MKGDYNKEVWARRWNDVVMFVFPSVVVLVNMWYPGILVSLCVSTMGVSLRYMYLSWCHDEFMCFVMSVSNDSLGLWEVVLR